MQYIEKSDLDYIPDNFIRSKKSKIYY